MSWETVCVWEAQTWPNITYSSLQPRVPSWPITSFKPGHEAGVTGQTLGQPIHVSVQEKEDFQSQQVSRSHIYQTNYVIWLPPRWLTKQAARESHRAKRTGKRRANRSRPGPSLIGLSASQTQASRTPCASREDKIRWELFGPSFITS